MVKIILTTYKGEKFIAEQIESVMKSEYKDFHLYVFDDCSGDGTPFCLDALSKKYPDRMTVRYNETNKGHMRNFLEGLFEVVSTGSSEDYYMFCDQDDIWFSKKIGITLSYMETLEKKYGKEMPLLVFTDATILFDKEERGSFIKQSRYDIKKRGPARILMENKGMGCTMLMNHVLASRMETIPKHARYHDWWIMLIASVFGKIGYIDRPTMFYRQHGKNEVGVSGFGRYVLGRLKKLKEQKKQLDALYLQAADFYKIFGNKMTAENKKIFKAFIGLKEQNWFERRRTVLKYGFLKSGIVRNIGLMLII